MSNKRTITIQDRDFESIGSAAAEFGLPRNTVDYRLSKGWTPEQAVGLEPRPSHAGNTIGIPVTVQGREFRNIKEAARHYDRAYTHIFARLKEGCSIEQALGLIKRTDTFQSGYPELAKQWHPTKNAPLSPGDFTPHSGHEVWWLCQDGHEWEAVMNSRARGYGCPYCAGQKPTAERNFATEYPELLEEWDWDKNAKDPAEYTPRSQYKVWWKCEKGHSWQASIVNRTRDMKNLCPYCSNRKVCEDNCLARVRPDIAQDWHPTRNAPLTADDVVAGGYKKVWWICKHGHEWKAPVGSRVNAGTGCSKCSLQTSRMEIAVYTELDALFEGVSWREKVEGFECDIYLPGNRIGVEVDGVYWHSREPEMELAKSSAFESAGIQLFRLREDGLSPLSERDISFKASENKFLVISKLVSSLLRHAELADEQRTRLREYVGGHDLVNEKLYREILANVPAPPLGESLVDKQPDIAAQWAYDMNAPLLPEHFRHQANKVVWWRCENGHTWKVSINNRTQHGTGCPKCPRQFAVVTDDRNLATINPDLAEEWHPEKNGDLKPQDIRPKSNRKVWWKCSNGHEWEAVVSGRASGHACPYCSGRFATKDNNLASRYPMLLKEWDQEKNKGLNPSNFTPHVGKKVWWRCNKGHSYQATIYNRAKNKSGCPECARIVSRKYSIEDIQAIAKERGGECLSTTYTSCRQRMKFRCKHGHEWETRADSIIYTNKWCPQCGRKRKASMLRRATLILGQV